MFDSIRYNSFINELEKIAIGVEVYDPNKPKPKSIIRKPIDNCISYKREDAGSVNGGSISSGGGHINIS